jgi:hypothetical protein
VDTHFKASILFAGAILAALGVPGCDADMRGPQGGPDAGGDTDADTDADADADAGPDGGTGCTELDYPPGPYGWHLDEVVGDADEVTELVMSLEFCTEVNSLVFALGADT